MKSFCLVLLGLAHAALAQKHDYVWVAGDGNNPSSTAHGGILIDFNQNPVDISYHFRELNMFVCNASICDTSGRLVAYTNGCHIAGADDAILENGENINPGSPHHLHCEQYSDGYASGIQSALFLSAPEAASKYYLFHKSYIITKNPLDVITNRLLYSVVDNSSGKGVVIAKNLEILNDTLAYGELVATRHANGRDWWILTPRRNSNTFYVFKLTPDGLSSPTQQTIGIKPTPSGEGYGQIVFSPDGAKIYRTNRGDPVMVYSFDRETGVFTDFDTIFYVYGNTPIGEIGCAVSPNGRFLYLGARKNLYQLDLQASDISASQTLVAEWDGVLAPVATLFWQLQLAPDCKIYGLAGGDTRYFHVIHHPDEAGLACHVEQRGLPLPTPSGASMPSFPNFRLGPLDDPGLPCSPVVSSVAPPTPLPPFSVFPNPVRTVLTVIPNRSFSGEGILRLFDLTGRIVLAQDFEANETATTIDVGALPGGVYWYEVWAEGRRQGSGKLVRLR